MGASKPASSSPLDPRCQALRGGADAILRLREMRVVLVLSARPEKALEAVPLRARHDVNVEVRHALAHSVVGGQERALGSEGLLHGAREEVRPGNGLPRSGGQIAQQQWWARGPGDGPTNSGRDRGTERSARLRNVRRPMPAADLQKRTPGPPRQLAKRISTACFKPPWQAGAAPAFVNARRRRRYSELLQISPFEKRAERARIRGMPLEPPFEDMQAT